MKPRLEGNFKVKPLTRRRRDSTDAEPGADVDAILPQRAILEDDIMKVPPRDPLSSVNPDLLVRTAD